MNKTGIFEAPAYNDRKEADQSLSIFYCPMAISDWIGHTRDMERYERRFKFLMLTQFGL